VTAPVEYWAAEELPGITWDPNAEPPHDDGDGPGIETVHVIGDLL
jgi:hypothetical protein